MGTKLFLFCSYLLESVRHIATPIHRQARSSYILGSLYNMASRARKAKAVTQEFTAAKRKRVGTMDVPSQVKQISMKSYGS